MASAPPDRDPDDHQAAVAGAAARVLAPAPQIADLVALRRMADAELGPRLAGLRDVETDVGAHARFGAVEPTTGVRRVPEEGRNPGTQQRLNDARQTARPSDAPSNIENP